ncbi:sugar ABC transporter permease [Bacillus sp. JCM 19041]|uniref:sugar ABC transporter permease n=1 Tax=Bacillus sp. JCM 19041 TaxID=1460637 RepID=UPI000B14FE18
MEKVLGNKKTILFFVGPALLFYLLLLIVPTLWSIGYSFFAGSPIRGFEFVGFANYTAALSDSHFIDSLLASIKYAAFVTTGQVALGLALALLFVFFSEKIFVTSSDAYFLPSYFACCCGGATFFEAL